MSRCLSVWTNEAVLEDLNRWIDSGSEFAREELPVDYLTENDKILYGNGLLPMALNGASEYKQGAWEFMKDFLDEDYLELLGYYVYE